ncbi:MAG: hypothetical protein WCH75_24050 [Candidatus Binatia bacterium]
MKLAANHPHQFDAPGHNIAATLSIFKATALKENGIDKSHLPPSRLFSVKTTFALRVTVTSETGAGNGFHYFHLFHFPAGNGRDKYRDDISVCHDTSEAVMTINSSLPLAMDS